MKRALLLLVCVAGLAAAPMRFPAYKKTVLPNGLTLLMMERHQVPLVSFTVAIKSGSSRDPAGKEGLGDITNDLLRKGAGSRTSDQISQDLDFIGATVSTLVSFDALVVTAEFMKKDLGRGLPILGDMLQKPTFPQSEVDKLLKQRVDEIRAMKDSPSQVIPYYYNGFLYGQHPYGRPQSGDERSVPSITRDDIVKFFEQNYVPGNMVISVAGDFATVDMEKLLAAQLGAAPKKDAPAFRLNAPAEATGRRLLLVDKPDATQTFFRIGNLGITRTNPDRVALELVNMLFGGRFTSMLNSALRINSGLTYGANSNFERRRERGPFYIASYTRNATTEKAMDMALDILKELHEKGPTEEQLRSTKAYLLGQYGPRIETTDQLAGLMADFEVFGLVPSEVDEYAARLDSVTMADVRRVIKQYYPLDNLVFAVIGKAGEIAPLMKKYAPTVEQRSISEPGFRK